MPRFPSIGYSRKSIRDDLLAALTEFVGTVTFLLLGLGGIQASATANTASLNAAATTTSNATNPDNGAASINKVASLEQLLYISTSMGLALLVSAWMFYRASGAVFNPNVAFALVMCKVLSPIRFILYCMAQFVGAIVASAILSGLLPGPLVVTPTLSAGTNNAQGVWIEAFITMALCLCVLMLAAEKSKVTPFAPIGIGLTLFVAHLWAVVYTGAGMNTARAFGPAVITGFAHDQWVYWLGPTIGAVMATIVYRTLKAIKYWELNPGQDDAKPELEPSPQSFTRVRSPSSPVSTSAELPPPVTQKSG